MLATIPQPAVEYRRLARRVRCRLGHNPIDKQRALAVLARHVDRDRSMIEAEAQVTAEMRSAASPEGGVRAFAAAVSTAMEGPILRFSRRQELIRQAEGLGIRRFDANLLIAAVQHRLGGEKARTTAAVPPAKSSWRYALPIGLIIGVQVAIFLGAWSLLHS